jgi:hypothetical protein
MFFCACFGYSEELIIKNIEIEISVAKTSLPKPVLKRIKESAKSVSERAMLNRQVSEIKQVKTSLEKILQKIFNQVLIGFYVNEVKINVDVTTVVYISIISSEKVVKSVKLSLDLSSVHPRWQYLFEKNLPEIANYVSPLLLGIPVESSSWAQDIINPLIDSIFKVNTFFPGFSISVDLNFGEETILILKLKPEKPQIRDIKIKIFSKTIPSIGFGHFKEQIYPNSKLIIGLPVEFVKANTIFLKKELEKELNKKIYQKFYIKAKVDFEINETTYIFLQIDSLKYDAGIEGRFNIGISEEEKPTAEARGWIGKKFTKRDKVLLRLSLEPSQPSLTSEIGISHELIPDFPISLLFDIKEGEPILWSRFKKEKWQIETNYSLDRGEKKEFAAGYKMRNFLRGEISFEREKSWVRLVLIF